MYVWRILEYQFPLKYYVPIYISENLEIIQVNLINLQNLIHKSDVNSYCARIVFDLLEKLLRTNIWMFLEYQFPKRYQLPKSFLKNVRRIEYVRPINIQDTTPKRNFDIYQMILINIPQKLAKNQCYLCRIIEYQSPLRYYFPLAIPSNFENYILNITD